MTDVPRSERLVFTRATDAHRTGLHGLLTDPYVRRYLLDGMVLEPEQTDAEIAASDALFDSFRVGLWLLAERASPSAMIGFAGFRVFGEEGEARPQLLYALREPYTGRGFAIEAARATIVFARAVGFREIVAGVDAPNARSIRLLEALGFQRVGELPGAFGVMYRYELAANASAPDPSR